MHQQPPLIKKKWRNFFETLQSVVKKWKNKGIMIVQGDFNAKVGEIGDGKVAGNFGLGERNEAGENLVDFCTSNKLSIANTKSACHK